MIRPIAATPSPNRGLQSLLFDSMLVLPKVPAATSANRILSSVASDWGNPEADMARTMLQTVVARKRSDVRFRMLYFDGAMVVAESGGVKLNGFPSAWHALVVVVCFWPVWTWTARCTNFSITMIRCLPIPLAGPAARSYLGETVNSTFLSGVQEWAIVIPGFTWVRVQLDP